tara:strand:- start:54 stop:539 length:486 start_codon:yes stop_codon:yes gene_type:complete
MEWWAKGGSVNFVILFSSFFLGIFYFNKKYSKGFTNIMIGVVPLLGLLGTVVGMIQTFNALQNSGTDVQSLAGGISKAMITTSSGLCVAIFGTIFLPLKKSEELYDYESLNDLSVEQLEEIVQNQNKKLFNRIKMPKIKMPKIKIPKINTFSKHKFVNPFL